jgi:parvulin-like peptidyl-prolyl isomerase
MRTVLWLGILAVACGHPAGGETGRTGKPEDHGALVARVGRVELHEDDLKRMMARDPGAAAERFESPAARRDLVQGLVRFELLAQAAERAGLTNDPDAIHAQRQIAVTKLVNQALGAAASPDAITSSDVEREYRARQATEFTLPAAAHVRHIRVSDRAAADRVLRQAKALAAEDDSGFAALATKTTEDAATRTNGGDLGFIDERSRVDPAIVKAALALTTPGEVTSPLAVGSGYEILRLVSLRAAAVSPLSSVEASIRQRLYRERRAKALDDYIAKLRTETPVEVVGGAN